MIVKYKVLENGIAPKKIREGDACLDLSVREVEENKNYIEYKLGVIFEIPKGYLGLLYARSSITKKDLMVKNSVGVIDSNYRGEVTLRCVRMNKNAKTYSVGDRAAQIRFTKNPEVELVEINELSQTERGDKGYGSSGN